MSLMLHNTYDTVHAYRLWQAVIIMSRQVMNTYHLKMIAIHDKAACTTNLYVDRLRY